MLRKYDVFTKMTNEKDKIWLMPGRAHCRGVSVFDDGDSNADVHF